jgi:hypothetical protein
MNGLRLDLQFFAEESLDDLLGYLGVETNKDDASNSAEGDNQGASADDTAGTDDSGKQTEGDKDNSGQDQNSTGEDNKQNTGNDGGIPEDQSKQAFAFAQLRQEANQKKQLLTGLQKILNIPEDTPMEDVMTKVQEAIVKAQSKQTGVPEEIITKLNNLEQRDKEYRAHQLQENAYLGFNKVQKEYGLDQAKIKEFAVELLKDNMNPFEQEVDVFKEYKLRHFDDIMKAEVAKAVQAEQERAAKAGTQSTQPNSTQGQTKGEQGKINSIKELDNWFDTQKK